MAQCAGFDLYDERWRDCWLAATSAARLRKKQVDVDIQQRVARLLEDYGPQSERPLTLRIYGTMIKGFCVINNERARTLCSDCERVVFTFARKPFAEGDNTIRLPAAKRPRMEAALTLDLDLARVEASEAFDWTQAPLEEGALLRLSGAQAQQDFVPTSFDFAGHGFAADAAGLGLPTESAWLPKLPGEVPFVEMVAPEPAAQDPLLLSQLVPAGPPEVINIDPTLQQQVEGELRIDQVGRNGEVALPQHRARNEIFVRPGVVYGFDDDMMLASEEYDYWQQSHSEISDGRLKPAGYAAMMSPEYVERAGPRLRPLFDPPDGLCWQVPSLDSMDPNLPNVQSLLSEVGRDGPQFPEAHLGGDNLGFGMQPGAEPGFWNAEMQQLGLCQEEFDDAAAGAGGAEAQDERTAQVGAILRSCLQRNASAGISFEDLVPPGVADVQTAACTFSALLALATAGEFAVDQQEAYGTILISNIV